MIQTLTRAMDSRSPAFAEDKLRGKGDIRGTPPQHCHSRQSGNRLPLSEPEGTDARTCIDTKFMQY